MSNDLLRILTTLPVSMFMYQSSDKPPNRTEPMRRSRTPTPQRHPHESPAEMRSAPSGSSNRHRAVHKDSWSSFHNHRAIQSVSFSASSVSGQDALRDRMARAGYYSPPLSPRSRTSSVTSVIELGRPRSPEPADDADYPMFGAFIEEFPSPPTNRTIASGQGSSSMTSRGFSSLTRTSEPRYDSRIARFPALD